MPTNTDDWGYLSEDWPKRTWDLPTDAVLGGLVVAGVEEDDLARRRSTARKFMALPVARAMPQAVRDRLIEQQVLKPDGTPY